MRGANDLQAVTILMGWVLAVLLLANTAVNGITKEKAIIGPYCDEVFQSANVCNGYENCIWNSDALSCVNDETFIYPTKTPTQRPTSILSESGCNNMGFTYSECRIYMDCQWILNGDGASGYCRNKPPTQFPTSAVPTKAPIKQPSSTPTNIPSLNPTTGIPSESPTSGAPTTLTPSGSPSNPTSSPFANPTSEPPPTPLSLAPTSAPSTTAPSTIAPSTLSPSTISPSSLSPSTIAPSTIAPSTDAPSAAPISFVPSYREGYSRVLLLNFKEKVLAATAVPVLQDCVQTYFDMYSTVVDIAVLNHVLGVQIPECVGTTICDVVKGRRQLDSVFTRIMNLNDFMSAESLWWEANSRDSIQDTVIVQGLVYLESSIPYSVLSEKSAGIDSYLKGILNVDVSVEVICTCPMCTSEGYCPEIESSSVGIIIAISCACLLCVVLGALYRRQKGHVMRKNRKVFIDSDAAEVSLSPNPESNHSKESWEEKLEDNVAEEKTCAFSPKGLDLLPPLEFALPENVQDTIQGFPNLEKDKKTVLETIVSQHDLMFQGVPFPPPMPMVPEIYLTPSQNSITPISVPHLVAGWTDANRSKLPPQPTLPPLSFPESFSPNPVEAILKSLSMSKSSSLNQVQEEAVEDNIEEIEQVIISAMPNPVVFNKKPIKKVAGNSKALTRMKKNVVAPNIQTTSKTRPNKVLTALESGLAKPKVKKKKKKTINAGNDILGDISM